MKMSLMIFSFFRDLHRIQDFLQNIWKDYKTGKCDLMTGSLVTNTALATVRQMEDDILASAPEPFNKKLSYDSIAIVVFYANAFRQGEDPEQKLK